MSRNQWWIAVLTSCALAPACRDRAVDAENVAEAWSLAEAEVVDLTHAFDADTIYWPTEEGFQFEAGEAGVTAGGYFYVANRFRSAEHGGTHIDSPIHFAEGRRTLDQIPIDQLIGPGVTVDVRSACAEDSDYLVSVEDFRTWEERHGRLPDEALVLLHTGFGLRWPDRGSYMGTDRRGPEGVAELHFPGLHPDAARWLCSERNIAGIGLDTPSIDHGPSTTFESHVILFEQEIPAFENVANLHLLPPKGFTVFALPMKIRGGSGGPLRIVAVLR